MMLWQPWLWRHNIREASSSGGSPGRAGPGHTLADVEVLAEDAAEVAVGEEDRSRTVPTPEAVLLSKVGEGAAHDGVASGFAGRPLPVQPIDATITRASTAVGQRRHRLEGTLLELGAAEPEVRRKHDAEALR